MGVYKGMFLGLLKVSSLRKRIAATFGGEGQHSQISWTVILCVCYFLLVDTV